MTDRTSFPLVFALWGAGLGAAGQYAKISVIFDQLPAVYPDAGAALGFIVSLVGFVGIVLGVVAGLVVARIRYRRAMLWALWVGAALSLFQATLPSLPWMLVSRALEGVSHLAMVVAAPTLIAQLSAERHRGFTLTLWSTFFSVAFTLLVVLGLPLVDAMGLPALFVAHAIWLVVFAVILGLFLRPLEVPPEGRLTLGGILRDHGAIYASPRIAAPGAGWMFYTFCFLAILTVLPPYIAPEWRAWVIGAMPLVSIGVSLTFGVYMLRHISAVMLVQIGFALCIASLLWLWMMPGLPVACLALAGALGLVQGASFAAVPQLNDTAAHQSQAYGGLAQTGNLGNTLGTPALLAVLSVAGFPGLVWTCIAVFLCGIAAHAWMAARRS
ncbi:MFS transporter [Tateyamaria sp. ANG-S1]|uniref:MFS transporter n=1 Tax=Tateyamaria sp. ANG-S1 TaxID=1577905 RepID=UPI00057DA095|nr:MFS transporter [Tateyamaria sp. ANG-S1]KIC49080.1 membrane protein [Tateyamaria sp. ANG-S1]